MNGNVNWTRFKSTSLKIAPVVFAAATIGFSSGASAAWPERTVTIIVPFSAGGITDVVARLAAERLNERLKQPFIVENTIGAAGTIAAGRAAKADPDGYTLFIAAPPQISIAPFMYKLSYDPIADFRPISVIATSPFVITAGKKISAATLPELVALAKAKPGEITYGSAGAGSLTHLAAAQFALSAKISLTHVPYKGVGPAFQDLVGGHIALMSPSPVELKPFLNQGTLKPLAITDNKRSPMVPGVPALTEFFPSHPVTTWNGILAPSKTPDEVINVVSRELMAAGKDPVFLAKLEKIGVEPVVHTPADFAKLIADDTEHWRKTIRELGMKPPQ